MNIGEGKCGDECGKENDISEAKNLKHAWLHPDVMCNE